MLVPGLTFSDPGYMLATLVNYKKEDMLNKDTLFVILLSQPKYIYHMDLVVWIYFSQ